MLFCHHHYTVTTAYLIWKCRHSKEEKQELITQHNNSVSGNSLAITWILCCLNNSLTVDSGGTTHHSKMKTRPDWIKASKLNNVTEQT